MKDYSKLNIGQDSRVTPEEPIIQNFQRMVSEGFVDRAFILGTGDAKMVKHATEGISLKKYLIEHPFYGELFVVEKDTILDCYRGMTVNPSVFRNGIRLNGEFYKTSEQWSNGNGIWFHVADNKTKGVYLSKTYKNIVCGMYDVARGNDNSFMNCQKGVEKCADELRTRGQ
jgi:hypothetical protein